jgi:hypothetical protein
MRCIVGLGALAVTVTLLIGCAAVPGSASKAADEHAGHHRDGAAATAAPAGYDRQMQAMHEMHQKMAAAKTREERVALMTDHMKTMQDGMGMMSRMRGAMMGDKGMDGGKSVNPMDPGTMKRRMDMMEMMMQMMMDHEGMKPPMSK